MRSLLTRFRAISLATALAVTPAVAVTAAPVAAQASTTHKTPARLKALAYAKKQLGDRYRFGAAGPNAFDCSGLTMRAYGKANKKIGGHSATAQWRLAKKKHQLRPYKHVRKGDLLFYGRPGDVYHVTMYAGKGKMIEAADYGIPVRIVKVRKGGLLSKVADIKG